MQIPISVRIECARGEIINALEKIQRTNNLPPCIMDGILSTVVSEVRSEAKLELINATNSMMDEKDTELEKAKQAAKKILPVENNNEEIEE